MNKTISINLNGQVFQIDEQAYDKLKNYLESIRSRFATSDGGQEIIADIEARIAEMFNERLNDRKEVITLQDIEEVMKAMGRPEDFESVLDEEEKSQPQGKVSRRLFRDPDDKVVAGVCAGISTYLGISDPIWMRLLFVIAVLVGFGSPVLIYIILCIIIPQARNASEKLQMRGENINISNIEKTIKEDLKDLKDRFENINSGQGARKARNVFERLVDLIINVVVFAIKFFIRLAAVILIIVGVLFIISFIVALALPVSMTNIPLGLLYPLIFTSKLLMFLGLTGLLLFVGIPALLLVYAGFRILLGGRTRIKGLGISVLGLWLVGLVLVIFVSAKTASDFIVSETVREEIPVFQPAGDTLILGSLNGDHPKNIDFQEFFEEGYFGHDDSAFFISGRVKLDIKKSLTDEFQLVKQQESQGRSKSRAYERAESIEYKVGQQDSILMFDSHFKFPLQDHFRGQQVKLILKVPEGKSVLLGRGVADIIYDVQNVTDTYDRDMIGHVWTMLPVGLTCMDCDELSEESYAPHGRAARELNLVDFESVKAEGVFNLEIKKGKTFKVYADGNQRFVDNLDIDKSGSELKISFKDFRSFFGRDKGTIYVTMPSLTEAVISGANITRISGFEEKEINLEVNGASKATIDVDAEKLELDINGASEVKLSGNGKVMQVEAGGASKLKAFDYEVSNCTIDVNGASKAEVNATDKLDAEAAGASEILYKGLPEISSDVKGFSSIKPSR